MEIIPSRLIIDDMVIIEKDNDEHAWFSSYEGEYFIHHHIFTRTKILTVGTVKEDSYLIYKKFVSELKSCKDYSARDKIMDRYVIKPKE